MRARKRINRLFEGRIKLPTIGNDSRIEKLYSLSQWDVWSKLRRYCFETNETT